MDHSWLKLRNGVFGFAVAATCASGLQFSGCLKSSRSVSGLGTGASDAAIQAEKDVTEKRRQEALIAKSAPNEPAAAARVRLPDTMEESEKTEVVSADDRGDSSLAGARPPIQQVAADRENHSVADSAIPEKTGDAAVEESWPGMSITPAGPNPFTDRGPGKKRAESPEQEVAASTSSSVPGSRVVGPTPPADWEADLWADPAASTPPLHPERTPSFELTGGTTPVESATAVVQAPAPQIDPNLQRVRALMTEAQAQRIRGEQHAAYRSALLAVRVAEDTGVQFAAGEETPQTLAKSIADGIWSAPRNVAKETRPAPTEPSIRPNPVSSHAFADVDSFAQWRSAPPAQANAPADLSHSRSLQPAAALPATPEIRPNSAFPSWTAVSSESGSNTGMVANPVAAVVPTTPGPLPEISGRPLPEQQVRGTTADHLSSGVEFAIARSSSDTPDIVIPGERPAMPAPFPVDVSGLIDPRSRIPSRAEEERPVLLAPGGLAVNTEPAPLAPSAFTVPTDSSPSWEEIKETFAADELPGSGEEPSGIDNTGLKWGIVGIISAILATLIGFRLTRTPVGGNAPPAVVAAPPVVQQEQSDERHQLRIKRAA